MSIVIAIIIFSAIVLFHELGHFLLAKKNGITVTEFSLGMGPRLFSTVKNGTRYSLKAFPIGGSCVMAGEDTGDEVPGTFNGAGVWGRISVVAAGPVFNFILAFVLAVIIVGAVGYDPSRIITVEEGSAAWEAGLREGDLIREYQGYQIDLGKDLYVYTYLNPPKEETVYLTVERDGEKKEIVYQPDVNVRYLLGFNYNTASEKLMVDSLIKGMPMEDAGFKAGDVLTEINGVKIPDVMAYNEYMKDHPLSDQPVHLVYVREGLEYETEITPKEYRTPRLGFSYNIGCEKAEGFDVLKYGAYEVKYLIRTTILSLKELVTGGLGVKDLSGPVGVVDSIGKTYKESRKEGPLMVLMNMLNMAVLLSANLGVMNLLPFPALDGGRLVFLAMEAIRKKPINREVEGMIHFAGLMLLMALMVVVMYNDLLKIF